jgi:hypothetical protein
VAPTYRFCGLVFASDVPPPGVGRSRGVPRWSFRIAFGGGLTPAAGASRVFRLPDGRVSLRVARDGPDHRLSFPELAEFVISPGRREILGRPIGGTSRATLGRLLVSQVLPRLLGLEGGLALHGGVVRAPDGAVALLGDSGAGKSTLCAAFGGIGVPLLTDDCFAVEATARRVVAVPGLRELRLLPDARGGAAEDGEGKRVFKPGGRFPFANAPAPLARIYVLAPRPNGAGVRVEISPLAPAQAFTALVRNSFQLDCGDRGRASALLDTVARIVERVPVRELRYPRRLSLLPALREAVITDRP